MKNFVKKALLVSLFIAALGFSSSASAQQKIISFRIFYASIYPADCTYEVRINNTADWGPGIKVGEFGVLGFPNWEWPDAPFIPGWTTSFSASVVGECKLTIVSKDGKMSNTLKIGGTSIIQNPPQTGAKEYRLNVDAGGNMTLSVFTGY